MPICYNSIFLNDEIKDVGPKTRVCHYGINIAVIKMNFLKYICNNL